MPEEIKIKLTLDDAEVRKNLEDQEGSGVKRSQGGLFRKRARESADASEKGQREKRGGLLAGAKARFPTVPGVAKAAAVGAGILATAEAVRVLAPLVAESVAEIFARALPVGLDEKFRAFVTDAVGALVDRIQAGKARLGATFQALGETKDILRGLAAADKPIDPGDVKEILSTFFEVDEFRLRTQFEIEEILLGATGRLLARSTMDSMFGSAQKDSVVGFEENVNKLISSKSWFGGAGR